MMLDMGFHPKMYVQLFTVDDTFSRLLGRNAHRVSFLLKLNRIDIFQPTPNFNTWCRQGSEGRLQIGYEETSS